MKLFRPLLLVLLCLVLTVLCACPAPDVIGPGSSTTTNNTGSSNTGSSGSGSGGGTVDPSIPVGATYRPSDTGERAAYWKKLSAPAGNFAASAYTNAASGLTNESATPTAGTDLAYGFTVPHDGNYEVGADMLALAVDNGEVTLAVYKNGARIWPVSEDAYTATTENGSARFTATTSAKKGDTVYIRVSGNTALNISPRVTLVSGGYNENRDIEKNFPTVGVLSDVGSTLTNGDFVMTPVTEPIDGITLAGNKVGNRILRKQIVAGEVIFVSDDGDVEIDATGREGVFDGKGATIVTGGSVTFVGLDRGTEITNLIIIADGGIYFSECRGGTLSNTALKGGVTVGSDCDAINFLSLRIEASGTALENKSAALNLVDSYVAGTTTAIVEIGNGNSLYYNCVLSGYHTAVILGGSDSTVRRSTVYGDIVTEGALENLLVAECVMKNIGAILYNNTHNSVILFNEVENVAVKNATNAYVAENAIYGGLLFDNVRYMIAEDNILATAVPALVSVRDYNGDNVTDTTARAEVGVNEDLLPHINRDAFLNMARKKKVRDSDREAEKNIRYYIRDEFYAGEKRVIVAPGAYYAESYMWISNVEDADAYGYGVLFELTDCLTMYFSVNQCERVGFYGFNFGYSESTSDQLVVLEKLGGNKLLCVNAAGTQISWRGNEYIPEAHRWDEPYPYSPDTGIDSATLDAETGLWTMSMTVTSRYEEVQVGDVISCRNGTSLFKMTETVSVTYEDVTVLGGAIRCFWDHKAIEGTVLHRVVDAPASAKIIDKATYDRYVALAEQYGLPANYLVYIDQFGNYRGMKARVASADFAHTSDSVTGFTVTSCIVSGLSDDGTNHQGWFDRVWKYDEETGIITYRYDNREITTDPGQTNSKEWKLRPFKKGERVCIFTSTGRLLVDTVALEDGTRDANGNIATVKIDKALLRESDLAEYDMENYDPYSVRVLIDNMSRNGAGAYFDNVLLENIRSRGLMIKCEDAVIQNCTLRNIGMSAIAILYEIDWRESGFVNNIVIKNNYIENTGYADNKAFYSPISLYAPAVQGTDDYHSFHNVVVEGNVVRDRGTAYALYANGVDGLIIKNNDFGDHMLWNPDCESDLYSYNMDTTAVLITFSKNIELSGNTYSYCNPDLAEEQVLLSCTTNVTGTDLVAADDERVISAIKTTSYANHEPLKNPNGGLIFSGGWDLGTVNHSFRFTSFNRLDGGGWWFNANGTTWSAGSVASYYREYRYVAASSSTAACIRYTMDADATVALSIARFYPVYMPLAGSNNVKNDALYAIFVNGEMVFPVAGGSFSTDSDWYSITRYTSYAEMERAFSTLTLELDAGDQILFAARLPQGATEDSMFALVPNVYYLS